jgi:hypothetical protein
MATGREIGPASPGPTGEWIDRFNGRGLSDRKDIPCW